MLASALDADPSADAVLLHLGDSGSEPEGRAAALGLPAAVTVLEVGELGIEREEISKLGLMYSTQGLAGAMKARLIRFLLARDQQPVIFVDADICVYRPMGWIAARALETPVALLTTHVGRPLLEAERPMLSAGVFNSGFLAVPPAGIEFVDWWCDRTARFSIFRPNRGLLWEQAWLSVAPAFFDVEVLRDPGVNTMARELLDQDVEWDSDDLPTLGGQPLTCYHFSGPYDPASPEFILAPAGATEDVVVRPTGDGFSSLSWLSLHNRPGATRLSQEYAKRLQENGFGEETPPPVFEAFDDGRPIHRAMRRAYRTGLMEAEREDGELPPNPFSGEPVEAFLDWLLEVPAENEATTGFSRLIDAVYETYEGAPIIFPRVPGPDADPFVEWAEARLRAERRSLPERLVPAPVAPGAAVGGRRRGFGLRRGTGPGGRGGPRRSAQ